MGKVAPHAAPHPSQLYRLPHLKQRLGVSGSSIWAWVKAGKFPKPFKLSENCTAWKATEVEAWLQSRIAGGKMEGTNEK